MEGVIKSHDRSDVEMVCEEKTGQWVKFHIPEEGEFGAHVNGLQVFNPFKYSMSIMCKQAKTHLCRDQSFTMSVEY